jgi:hypothetical protein
MKILLTGFIIIIVLYIFSGIAIYKKGYNVIQDYNKRFNEVNKLINE